MHRASVRIECYAKDQAIPHIKDNDLVYFINDSVYNVDEYIWSEERLTDVQNHLCSLGYESKSNPACCRCRNVILVDGITNDFPVLDMENIYKDFQIVSLVENRFKQGDLKPIAGLKLLQDKIPELHEKTKQCLPRAFDATLICKIWERSSAVPFVDGKTMNFFVNPRITNTDALLLHYDETREQMHNFIREAFRRTGKINNSHYRQIGTQKVFVVPDGRIREEYEYSDIVNCTWELVTVTYEDEFEPEI
jgi:hypothetical protein